MKGKLTLLLGGVRSGKSRTAEKMANSLGERVLYVATAEAKDEEMRARIEAHRSTRPVSWRTLEARSDIGSAVQTALAKETADVVLLDCFTMLVSNVLLQGIPDGEPDRIDATAARDRVAAELDAVVAALDAHSVPWIIVSNEVGWGVVPPSPLGRIYRDLLGWANQRLAEVANAVYLMVAGLPLNITRLGSGEED